MNRAALSGCRVLLTRPAGQSAAWREAFTNAGALAIDFPTIEVVPPPSWAPLDEAFARLASYDWLIFSSANAARFACGRLTAWPAVPPRPRVAAVGDETARTLRGLGLPVDLVPSSPSQDGLIAALADLQPGTRVLFPRALGGRDQLPEALVQRGVVVDVVPASQTLARVGLPPPPPFDVSTFASPSALAAFADQLGTGMLSVRPCVVIGETTADKARALGLTPSVARSPRVEAVIEAIAHSSWRS